MNYDILIKEYELDEKQFPENFEKQIETAIQEQEKFLKLVEDIEEIMEEYSFMKKFDEYCEDLVADTIFCMENPRPDPFYFDYVSMPKNESKKLYESTDWQATCFAYGYEGGINNENIESEYENYLPPEVDIKLLDDEYSYEDGMESLIENYLEIEDENIEEKKFVEEYTNSIIPHINKEIDEFEKYIETNIPNDVENLFY